MSIRIAGKTHSVAETSKGLSQTDGKKKPEKFSPKPFLKMMKASGTNVFECLAQGVKGFDFTKRAVTKGAVKPPTATVQLPTNAPVNRR